jgi:fructuronate reductase
MKVGTCLNPVHTSLAVYGCLLDHHLICDEMKDEELNKLARHVGYDEGLPVVVDPKILDPKQFIDTVIEERLPNPYMPDSPFRIGMDTSQKLPIRFGETIKKYIARGLDMSNLVLIPLTLAGYARYLKGIKDDGTPFEPSPDPMLAELQKIVAPLEIGKPDQDWSPLHDLYSRKDVFGINLYEAGLGSQIEGMVKELFAGVGAVRATLHKYVTAR